MTEEARLAQLCGDGTIGTAPPPGPRATPAKVTQSAAMGKLLRQLGELLNLPAGHHTPEAIDRAITSLRSDYKLQRIALQQIATAQADIIAELTTLAGLTGKLAENPVLEAVWPATWPIPEED